MQSIDTDEARASQAFIPTMVRSLVPPRHFNSQSMCKTASQGFRIHVNEITLRVKAIILFLSLVVMLLHRSSQALKIEKEKNDGQ